MASRLLTTRSKALTRILHPSSSLFSSSAPINPLPLSSPLLRSYSSSSAAAAAAAAAAGGSAPPSPSPTLDSSRSPLFRPPKEPEEVAGVEDEEEEEDDDDDEDGDAGGGGSKGRGREATISCRKKMK